MAHAILSPSATKRWAYCRMSPAMEKGMPEQETGYAACGTRAHRLAELSIREIFLKQTLSAEELEERKQLLAQAAGEADDVQANIGQYLQVVQEIVEGLPAEGFKDIQVEQRLDVSPITTEEGAQGTADFLAITDDDLWIVDLKYGAGIPVEAFQNCQLSVYGNAALDLYSVFGCEPKNVHLIICQPRCGGVRRWDTTAEQMFKFRGLLRPWAERAMALYRGDVKPEDSDYHPDAETCRFCRAKMQCPRYTAMVKEGLKGDYEVVDENGQPVKDAAPVVPESVKAELTAIPIPSDAAALAKAHSYLPLIEQWCKEVASATLARLQAGENLPGLKLVEGRRGPRKWGDPAAAEEMLKRMRIKREQMYDFKLISPTTAEKLIKAGVIGERQAKAVREAIVQAAGSPVVAPIDDPREALPVGGKNDFEALPNE